MGLLNIGSSKPKTVTIHPTLVQQTDNRMRDGWRTANVADGFTLGTGRAFMDRAVDHATMKVAERYPTKQNGTARALQAGAVAAGALSLVLTVAAGPLALVGLAGAALLWGCSYLLQRRAEQAPFDTTLQRAAEQQRADELAAGSARGSMEEPTDIPPTAAWPMQDPMDKLRSGVAQPDPYVIAEGAEAGGGEYSGGPVQVCAWVSQSHQSPGHAQRLDETRDQTTTAIGSLRKPGNGLQVRAAIKQGQTLPWYPLLRNAERHYAPLAAPRPAAVWSKVSAYSAGGYLYVANQGACRALMCSKGAATRLSVDHVEREASEAKRLATRPQELEAYGLTRALMAVDNEDAAQSSRAQVSRVSLRQARGKWVVLMSPEMTRVFTDSEIATFMAKQPANRCRDEIAHVLTQMARRRGASLDLAASVFQVPTAAESRWLRRQERLRAPAQPYDRF